MSEPLTDPHKKMQNGKRLQGKMLNVHLVSCSRNNTPIDLAEEIVERQQAETELHTRLQQFFMMVQQLMLLWKVISTNDFYSTFNSM
jgi:hypothetical protein